MRRSTNSIAVAGACLVTAVLCGTVANVRSDARQSARWSGPIDTISVAHQMLQAFFPELQRHSYPMVIVHDHSFDQPALSVGVLRSFDIGVEESVTELPQQRLDKESRYLVVGRWLFTPEGDLEDVILKGRATNYLEHQQLLAEMSKHPTSSPAELRGVLVGRGVRFLPEHDQEFLASIRPALEKLAALLGGTTRNVRVAFNLGVTTFGPPHPPPPAANCDLEVEMEIVSFFQGRPTRKVALTFEPIGGKLLHIIGVD